MMNAPAVTLRRWTREEYERMVEFGILTKNDRVELVGGEIVEVSPQNSPHATALALGAEALRLIVAPNFHVRVQSPLALDPDSEPEPDLAVVSGGPRDYRDAHPTFAALIVEVADSSLAFDRRRKAGIYARAGIPDYWVENLVDGVLEAYRDPAPDPSAPFGYAYRERRMYGTDERIELLAVPGAVVQVRDLLP